MILISPEATEAALQIVAQKLDGTPKLNIVSGSVRVYSLDETGETEILPPTALVGTDYIWRYVWEFSYPLSLGQYIVEYTLIDSDTLENVTTEDLCVFESSGGGGSGGWDELLEDHQIDNSMGEVMNELWKVIYKIRFGDRYKSSKS